MMRAVLAIAIACGLAEAAPPYAYRCYPGKPKVGEGCTCPAAYKPGRDRVNTATCTYVPPPPIAAPKLELTLVVHDLRPQKPPELAKPPLAKKAPDPIVSIPPPPPPKVGVTDREVEALRMKLGMTTGPARVPILDRLVDALATRAYRDPTNTKRAELVMTTSDELLAEPDFARYAKADGALYRHAELQHARGKTADARKTLARLINVYRNSAWIPDAHLWLAERHFEAMELTDARAAYERAVATGAAKPLVHFARYKLAWIAWNQTRHADAKRLFEAVVKSGDARLRAAALQDLVRTYAEIGAADKAFAYFEKLDAPTALAQLRRLADLLQDQGKAAKARIVYRDIVSREDDLANVCTAAMGSLRASLLLNNRSDMLLDIAAFSSVATGASAECKQLADEMLGEVGMVWHLENTKTKADARELIEVWTHALAVTTTSERRDTIQNNLAIALWAQAATARGARPADWIVAGEALQKTSRPELSAIAIDAYDNAIRAARATKQVLSTVLSARLRGGLQKLPGDRAKQLLAQLQ